MAWFSRVKKALGALSDAMALAGRRVVPFSLLSKELSTKGKASLVRNSLKCLIGYPTNLSWYHQTKGAAYSRFLKK
ncbi:hypothetical protein JCM8547_001361 [Rhodosporidiobolus lusitaniae]